MELTKNARKMYAEIKEERAAQRHLLDKMREVYDGSTRQSIQGLAGVVQVYIPSNRSMSTRTVEG